MRAHRRLGDRGYDQDPREDLRALENEEWGLLPGPVFVKSFLRTYAQALGLDGKSLWRNTAERGERGRHDSRADRLDAGAPARAQGRLGPLARIRGGGERDRGDRGAADRAADHGRRRRLEQQHTTRTRATAHPKAKHAGRHAAHTGVAALGGLVSLQLRPTATVYVCLIGDAGQADLGPAAGRGRKHPGVSRQALRTDARQQQRVADHRRHPAHGGGVERTDRLLDHEGPRPQDAGGGSPADVHVSPDARAHAATSAEQR